MKRKTRNATAAARTPPPVSASRATAWRAASRVRLPGLAASTRCRTWPTLCRTWPVERCTVPPGARSAGLWLSTAVDNESVDDEPVDEEHHDPPEGKCRQERHAEDHVQTDDRDSDDARPHCARETAKPRHQQDEPEDECSPPPGVDVICKGKLHVVSSGD